MPPADWAPELFRRVAVPRLAGSPARHAVSAVLAERLGALGYSVRHEDFVASPRRLTAIGVGAAGIGWSALLIFPLLLLPLPGWPVVLIGGAALTGSAVLGLGVAQGALLVGPRAVNGTNLTAVKGTPRIWIVAHADSKGQALSLRGRVVALGLLAAATAALVLALGLRAAGPLPWGVALPIVLATAGAAGALSRDPLRNDSPGAVDNASGVVAALVAAATLEDRTDVGFVISDAEEFGMEGARAWVRDDRPGDLFLNIDGLDARGHYRIMRHAAHGAERDRAGSLVETLERVLADGGHPAVVGRLPPGILVDGVVLAAAGMTGVTLSRGDWTTLGVVHTPADSVERTDVVTAVVSGQAIAEAVTRFLG